MSKPVLLRTALFLLITCFYAVLLPACQGQFLPITNTATPTTPTRISPTPTRTATIVWFPTRVTPTRPAAPSVMPTSNQRPAVGELVFRDLFDDPAEWQTVSGQAAGGLPGSVAFGKRELTFALSTPKETLTSLRKTPPPADFFLEITVNAALCRGDDAYGVLFRVNSARDAYRLLVNCRGEMRLERMKGFEVIPLEDWSPSTVPPGSPAVTRLGIWAAKGEFRIFANEIYQFSARDPVWSGGQIGLFARVAANSPLTVSFSDLTVRVVDPARVPTVTPTQPTLTSTPRRNP